MTGLSSAKLWPSAAHLKNSPWSKAKSQLAENPRTQLTLNHQAERTLIRAFAKLVIVLTALLTLGCSETLPPAYKLNSVEFLRQEKLFLSNGEHFDDSYKQEIGSILTAIFGTPDAPLVPVLLKKDDPVLEVMQPENIAMAAGPVNLKYHGKGGGLYRQHCSHCHGITGDGHGPTAASLNPYPRDFRLGKFKYKSTPLRSVPRDRDLTKVLVNGVPGTSMPSFRTLPDDEIAALVDYVKFLTIRGQYERYLMAELGNLDPGEPLIDLELAEKYHQLAAIEQPSQHQQEELEKVQEQHLDSMWDVVGARLMEDVIQRWVDADAKETAITEAPDAFDSGHDGHRDFVALGRELFYKRGNCAQCHGDTGVGNGQIESFDDWTNDWIKTPGVNPFNPKTYKLFTEAGALKPRPIKPRNLTRGRYRGGGHPHEIYLRISNGIEGTPMPAAPALTSDEVWALVAYVKFLPYGDLNEVPDRRINEKAIAR